MWSSLDFFGGVQVVYFAKICLGSHTYAYGPLHRGMSLYVNLATFLLWSGCPLYASFGSCRAGVQRPI
jgi:hypothetical protein